MMILTPYSFCMALVWFTVFVLPSDRLYRKTGFLLHYHTGVLLCLLLLSAVRLFLPMETGFTKVISSDVIVPAIQNTLVASFTVGTASLNLLRLLLAVWLAGGLIFFLRFLVKLYQGKRYLRFLLASDVQDPVVLRCFRAVTETANRKQTCRLITSPYVPIPMITGIVRPTILLPLMVTDLPPQQLRYILQHEYSHILNRDLSLKAFLEVLCCALWWNPVVYLLKNSLGQALEVKCDLRVTKALSEAETTAYLQTILDILRRANGKSPQKGEKAVLMSASYLGETEVFALRRRLTVVSGYASAKKRSIAVLLSVMLLLFALSYTVVVQPAYPAPPDDYLEVTPENAYIARKTDGKYALYVDGAFSGVIPENELPVDPYNTLQIIYE